MSFVFRKPTLVSPLPWQPNLYSGFADSSATLTPERALVTGSHHHILSVCSTTQGNSSSRMDGGKVDSMGAVDIFCM